MDAVCPFVPPIGRHAAIDLYRSLVIAIGRVMVIPGRIDLDAGRRGNPGEGLDIHVCRAATGDKDVDQLFARPPLHVNAVKMASHDVLRNASRQQKRAAAFLSDFQEHQAN